MHVAHLSSSEPTGHGTRWVGPGPQRPRFRSLSVKAGSGSSRSSDQDREGPSQYRPREGEGAVRTDSTAVERNTHGGPTMCRVDFLRDHHHPAF